MPQAPLWSSGWPLVYAGCKPPPRRFGSSRSLSRLLNRLVLDILSNHAQSLPRTQGLRAEPELQ